MKPQITTNQLLATSKLLKNLKNFVNKNYGSITNVMILYNQGLPNTIVVKYEKDGTMAGERDHQFRIATIAQDGNIEFIDEKFKNIFERASFLSECLPLDIDDEKQYDKID